MWCLCIYDIYPTIISASHQFVALSFDLDHSLLACAPIYASTNLDNRQKLWHDLIVLNSSYILPWSFFGDFNAIIRTHEHCGHLCIARSPMTCFKLWTDSNDLLHLRTSGARFSLSNKCDPPFYVEIQLTMCVGSQRWIDCSNQISVLTLPKVCSDHFLLLLEIHINQVKIASQFKLLKA